MQALTLKGVTRRFGSVTAVDGVDLAIPEGRLVCFLGPSGCGKTTLLRLIAGLERASAGRIHLGGEDITEWPAHRRNLGMVFQSLALFPHLNVADNIAYGLRIRGRDRQERRRRVEQLLELVRLPGLGARQIDQLSGGQRQRVAIARALALEPRLFLLDEPLSALDAKLREEMQIELRLLQQRVNVTTVLVTHDQREAMTMADLVAVMNAGRIEQLGTPLEIYRRPANAFVAEFIGTSNLLEAQHAEQGWLELAGHRLQVAQWPERLAPDAPLTLSIRPEDVRVWPAGHGGDNCIEGEVGFVRDVGQSVELYVECAGTRIVSHTTPRERPDVARGDRVTVELPAAACVVLTR